MTWLDIDDEPLAGHPLRSTAPVREAALHRERAIDVQALLEYLPPKDRAAVVMLYWYDLSYQEIAEVTGTTVSAVKSRLHRARVALAEAMSGNSSGKATVQPAARPQTAPAAPALTLAWA